MLAGAAITVAAGTDFVVERTVNFVGFSTEDRGEVVRHCEGLGGVFGGAGGEVVKVGRGS